MSEFVFSSLGQRIRSRAGPAGRAKCAATLSISEKTVRNHITRIFAKLKVEPRAQAIVLSPATGFTHTVQ